MLPGACRVSECEHPHDTVDAYPSVPEQPFIKPAAVKPVVVQSTFVQSTFIQFTVVQPVNTELAVISSAVVQPALRVEWRARQSAGKSRRAGQHPKRVASWGDWHACDSRHRRRG